MKGSPHSTGLRLTHLRTAAMVLPLSWKSQISFYKTTFRASVSCLLGDFPRNRLWGQRGVERDFGDPAASLGRWTVTCRESPRVRELGGPKVWLQAWGVTLSQEGSTRAHLDIPPPHTHTHPAFFEKAIKGVPAVHQPRAPLPSPGGNRVGPTGKKWGIPGTGLPEAQLCAGGLLGGGGGARKIQQHTKAAGGGGAEASSPRRQPSPSPSTGPGSPSWSPSRGRPFLRHPGPGLSPQAPTLGDAKLRMSTAAARAWESCRRKLAGRDLSVRESLETSRWKTRERRAQPHFTDGKREARHSRFLC